MISINCDRQKLKMQNGSPSDLLTDYQLWSLLITILSSIALVCLLLVISYRMIMFASTPELHTEIAHILMLLFFLFIFWGSAQYGVFCLYQTNSSSRVLVESDKSNDLELIDKMIEQYIAASGDQHELIEFMKQMMNLNSELQQRVSALSGVAREYHISFHQKEACGSQDADFFAADDKSAWQLQDAHFHYEFTLLQQLISDLDYMVHHLSQRVLTQQDMAHTRQQDMLASLHKRRQLRDLYRSHQPKATTSHQMA